MPEPLRKLMVLLFLVAAFWVGYSMPAPACGVVKNFFAATQNCSQISKAGLSLYTSNPEPSPEPAPFQPLPAPVQLKPSVVPSVAPKVAPNVASGAASGAAAGTLRVDLTSINKSLSEFGPDNPAKLVLRCRNRTANIALEFPGHPVSRTSASRRVAVKLDNQPAAAVEFAAGQGMFVVGLWRHEQAMAFMSRLTSVQSLKLETASEEDIPLTAEFALQSRRSEIATLHQSCRV